MASERLLSIRNCNQQRLCFSIITYMRGTDDQISLYCLALFYKIAQEELKPYKPVLKFAAIKLVIFFCYW